MLARREDAAAVEVLNRLLLKELGEERGVYRWAYSEELYTFESVDHTDSGIWLARPELLKRKLLVTLENQWVMMWRRPDQKTWKPVGGKVGLLFTEKGRNPTLDDTLKIIAGIRSWREMSPQDDDAWMEQCLALREKERKSAISDFVDDITPAVNGVPSAPGKKGMHSFGGIDKGESCQQQP